jgi:hypothetical protein
MHLNSWQTSIGFSTQYIPKLALLKSKPKSSRPKSEILPNASQQYNSYCPRVFSENWYVTYPFPSVWRFNPLWLLHPVSFSCALELKSITVCIIMYHFLRICDFFKPSRQKWVYNSDFPSPKTSKHQWPPVRPFGVHIGHASKRPCCPRRPR